MQWIISKLSVGKNKWSKCKILAQILGFPTSVENMVGGGGGWGVLQNLMSGEGAKLNTWKEHGGTVKKYLRRSSFESKVASYKPASLQIY